MFTLEHLYFWNLLISPTVQAWILSCMVKRIGKAKDFIGQSSSCPHISFGVINESKESWFSIGHFWSHQGCIPTFVHVLCGVRTLVPKLGVIPTTSKIWQDQYACFGLNLKILAHKYPAKKILSDAKSNPWTENLERHKIPKKTKVEIKAKISLHLRIPL